MKHLPIVTYVYEMKQKFYLDAINYNISVACDLGDDRFDFTRGNIFSLPTECVSSAIFEVKVPFMVHHKYISYKKKEKNKVSRKKIKG